MKEKDEFLDEVEKAARDANETYSHYKEQYEEGKRDPEFLRNYAYVLRNAKKDDSLVVEQHISTLEEEDFYEPVNVWFIYDFALIDNRPVWSLESKPFRFMYDERSVFHEYYDENVIKPRLLVMTYLNLMDIAGEQYDELFKENLPLIEEFEDELPLFDNGPGASIGFMTPDLKSQLLFVYHANAGDFDKAMGYMDVILENDLSDKLHFGLGNLMLQHLPADEEILKIIKDLKRPYFEKNPDNVFSKYSYARLLDKMGKTERAQKYASEVLDELTMFNFNYVRYEEEIHNMKEIVKK